MEKIKFSIDINAPKDKVWKALWNDDTYPQWTSAFAEGSKADTDWKEGSKVIFHSGTGDGMLARIATNKPNEYMSIEHLGMIKDGVEDTTSDEVKKWVGAKENYTLSANGNGTKLDIDMDTVPDFQDYFTKTWPLALDKLKKIAESN